MTAPDSMPDPTKLADNLKAWAQGLEQKAARYGELQSRLDATSVTRTSSDGAVRVTVDAKGVPTELTITDRGRGADPQALSAALMSTMRQAQAELRDRVATLTTETVGDDGPANDIVAGYRDQFPDPEPAFGGVADEATHDIGALEDETADYGTEPQGTDSRPSSRPARDESGRSSGSTDSTDGTDDDDDTFGGSILR